MTKIQTLADRMLGLVVPQVKAAAAGCYSYTDTQCMSSRCSQAIGNPRLVQYRYRTCYSWACEMGCDGWNYAGCCSI